MGGGTLITAAVTVEAPIIALTALTASACNFIGIWHQKRFDNEIRKTIDMLVKNQQDGVDGGTPLKGG
jgi:hypothetical protein